VRVIGVLSIAQKASVYKARVFGNMKTLPVLTYDEAKRRAIEAIRRQEQNEQRERTSAPAAHTCSYYCLRPECIKAQRDELRDKYVICGNVDRPGKVAGAISPA